MIPLGVLASAYVAPTGGGGWTPADLPSLDLWLAADTITGLSDGAPVTTWPDSSPAAINASTTGTVTYRTGQVNALPAVDFAGSFATTGASASGPDQTIVTVFRSDTITGNRTIMGPTAMGGLQLRTATTTGKLQLLSAGVAIIGTGATTITAGTWYIATATFSDTADTWSLRLARAADGSGTTAQTLTAGPRVRIGSHHTSAEQFDGMVAEAIHCSTVLSAADIASVEGYLATKYGL